MTTESFIEGARELIENQVEYESNHIDAGNNYSHLASEGDFDYHNGDDRLSEYCKEMGIDLTGIEIELLAGKVIFWSYMTRCGSFDYKKRFLVASYQVGEIEIQVDSTEIGARFTPYIIDKLNRETDAYWRADYSRDTAYAYIQTDAYWDQVADEQTIRDLVEAQKESNNA
tara:strand:- start:1640 stop:2152 length:513 start_codon:yes stop_codon:yes gene_type:complete